MDDLLQLIDDEFSVYVIGTLNRKLDAISSLIAANGNGGTNQEIEDEILTLLGEASKEFFTQGFLRGIAAVKGNAV